MTHEEAIEKLRDLMKSTKLCMLTTMTEDGQHVSRPMGVQETEFGGDVWFFTYEDSNKVRQVRHNPQVNVAFSNEDKHTWVSLSGAAEVVHDRNKAEELWNPFLKAWFPDGLETEGLTLLKVKAESAEYWDSPIGKGLALFGTIKAAVTGKPPESGENKTISL